MHARMQIQTAKRCLTLLLNTLEGHSGVTLWCDTFVALAGHSGATLFKKDTLYHTHMWNTHVGHTHTTFAGFRTLFCALWWEGHSC